MWLRNLWSTCRGKSATSHQCRDFPRHRPGLERLEDRAVPAILVEDFSLDLAPSLPGFDSTGAFLHNGSSVQIQSVASATGAPISLPHVLSVFRFDNVTFPGQTVDFASVAANTLFGGGRVIFFGTNSSVCFESPGAPPPPPGLSWTYKAMLGLPGQGNPDWVIVSSQQGPTDVWIDVVTNQPVTGVNLGEITGVRLEGGEIRFDDVTINTVTTAPPPQSPPIAVADFANTFPNTPVSIHVLANDSDNDGDPLTITHVSPPANGGTAVVNNNMTPSIPSDDFIVYTPPTDFVGPDTFTYTVDDGHGNTDTTTVTTSVQHGGFIPDPCDPTQTAFQIVGTRGDDVVRFAPEFIGSAHTVVLLNNNVVGRFLSVSRIIFYGFEGDDDIGITNFPALYFGGPGNDIMTGGNRADVLVGGPGNDILLGRQGNDVLIGGAGFDFLTGGNGEDILIGGTIDYDEDPQALCAISDEWASSRSRGERISNLRTGVGPGNSIQLTSSSIHDDAAIDLLFGGFGDDWFPILYFGDFRF